MNMYAVLQGDDIVSQWYPTQDQALFEAYSLGLIRRNKQTDRPYFPVDVRIISTSKRMANLIKKISKG